MKPEINDKAEEAMKVLLKECNILGCSNVGHTIAEMLKQEHRTIQQNFMRELHTAIREYSNTPTDLRNEGAVEFAKGVQAIPAYMPYV